MKKLTRRQLINSLVFPIMTTVWGLLSLAFTLFLYGFSELRATDFVPVAAIIIGGILCGVLTATLGIETGQYFLPRICILLSTIFVISVADEFLGNDPIIEFFLLLVSNAINAIYFVKRTKSSEWIIIFLSNPVLYYLVYFGIKIFGMFRPK